MPKQGNVIGAWAFLIGVILAIIFGLFSMEGAILSWILVIIGIVVGLLNIADKEVQPFLFGGVALVIVTALKGTVFPAIISGILDNIMIIFVPATVVVALSYVFGLARK